MSGISTPPPEFQKKSFSSQSIPETLAKSKETLPATHNTQVQSKINSIFNFLKNIRNEIANLVNKHTFSRLPTHADFEIHINDLEDDSIDQKVSQAVPQEEETIDQQVSEEISQEGDVVISEEINEQDKWREKNISIFSAVSEKVEQLTKSLVDLKEGKRPIHEINSVEINKLKDSLKEILKEHKSHPHLCPLSKKEIKTIAALKDKIKTMTFQHLTFSFKELGKLQKSNPLHYDSYLNFKDIEKEKSNPNLSPAMKDKLEQIKFNRVKKLITGVKNLKLQDTQVRQKVFQNVINQLLTSSVVTKSFWPSFRKYQLNRLKDQLQIIEEKRNEEFMVAIFPYTSLFVDFSSNQSINSMTIWLNDIEEEQKKLNLGNPLIQAVQANNEKKRALAILTIDRIEKIISLSDENPELREVVLSPEWITKTSYLLIDNLPYAEDKTKTLKDILNLDSFFIMDVYKQKKDFSLINELVKEISSEPNQELRAYRFEGVYQKLIILSEVEMLKNFDSMNVEFLKDLLNLFEKQRTAKEEIGGSKELLNKAIANLSENLQLSQFVVQDFKSFDYMDRSEFENLYKTTTDDPLRRQQVKQNYHDLANFHDLNQAVAKYLILENKPNKSSKENEILLWKKEKLKQAYIDRLMILNWGNQQGVFAEHPEIIKELNIQMQKLPFDIKDKLTYTSFTHFPSHKTLNVKNKMMNILKHLFKTNNEDN